FSVHCHSISQADTPDAEEEYVHVKAYYYNTESGNREDIKDFNFHHSSHCSVLFICTQAVMEDYDTICERKVEICLEKRMMIYFELQAMHSSHMQAEALMGYLGFCIRHVKSEYSSCRIVVKVYKHISIQSNGIEDREFNSNRGIHHLFFTVKNFYKYYTGTERTRHQIEVSSYVHDDLWY
ncbi:hypothetical protein T4B_12047, partial [Trichinella pseudospiralis]